MQDIQIQFTDKEITPWGGMVLLKKMLDQTGFSHQIPTISDLPQPGSNRGYKPQTIIEAFLVSIWCGANRFLHTEITRHDSVLTKIFGWKQAPAQDAYKRYFGKFTQAINQKVFNKLYSWFFNELKFDNFTIDFDSSVLTRYGEQQGAKVGYNAQKPGRKSHHPLMAFIDDCNMIANLWLRPGNTGASSNFINFLEDTIEKLRSKKIGLLRADSGFFSESTCEYLEDKGINYIISTKFYSSIKHSIARAKTWQYLDEGIEISEEIFKCPGWKKPRRIVIIRQKIETRPKATGKKVSLFGEEIEHGAYRYSCFITNLELPAAIVWRCYRGRANAENRIKELKYDFGFDSFNLNDFFATEAALNFAMLAYNFMSLFRQFIINSKTQQRLSTLRFKVFAIGAYLIKDGRNVVLKLSLTLKRREWFSGLWDSCKQFSLPVKFSNA